jgi:hypothetical protein
MHNIELLVNFFIIVTFFNYWFLISRLHSFFSEHYSIILLFIQVMEAVWLQICSKFIMSFYCRKVINMRRTPLLKQSTQHKLISPFFPVLSWTSYSYTRLNPFLYPPVMYLPFCIINAQKNWFISLLPWESQLRENFDEVPKRISWTARRELWEELRHKETNFL